jgi:hypothetical protein
VLFTTNTEQPLSEPAKKKLFALLKPIPFAPEVISPVPEIFSTTVAAVVPAAAKVTPSFAKTLPEKLALSALKSPPVIVTALPVPLLLTIKPSPPPDFVIKTCSLKFAPLLPKIVLLKVLKPFNVCDPVLTTPLAVAEASGKLKVWVGDTLLILKSVPLVPT